MDFFNMNNSETALEAFTHLRLAVDRGLISFSQCSLYEDLFCCVDSPNDIPRFTYVIFDPQKPNLVIAQCVIVFSHWISEDTRKWHIGWCVDEIFRNRGLGLDIATKALAQFSTFKQVQGDYIEASVDQGNIASLKISEKLIGSEEILFNEETGLAVHSFLKFIGE